MRAAIVRRTVLVLTVALAICAMAVDGFAQGRGGGGGRGGRPRPDAGAPAASQPAPDATATGSQTQQRRGGGAADPGSAPMQREATEADADALLDDTLVIDPAKIQAAKAKAEEKPPQTDDADILALFYVDRARAAATAGIPRQQLADLRQAAEYARRGSQSLDKTAILQQLANTEADRGNKTNAIKVMNEAIASDSGRGNNRLIGLYTNLANLNVRAGNIDAADAAVTQARAVRRQMENSPRFRTNGGARRSVARAVGSIARVLNFKGQYAEAEAAFRESIGLFEDLDTGRDRQSAWNERGWLVGNLRQQGRLAEAENLARENLSTGQTMFGSTALQTGSALLGLAAVLADQGRYVEAEGLARKAIELRQQRGLSGIGGPRMTLAYALAGQGKWPAVLKEIELTERSYRSRPEDFEAFVGRSPIYGIALLKAGKTVEALDRLGRLYDLHRTELGDKHPTTAESLGFLAMARAAAGQQEAALGEFVAATQILLSRSRENTDIDDPGAASASDQQQRMILESYIGLLADIRGTELAAKHKLDPVAESFRLADAAHSRSVLRALAASAARAAASNPQLADSARRVQDAEKQISALNGLLANAISVRAADRDEAGIKELRRRIDKLRDERAALMQEIERKFPDYARLVNPQPATVAEVAKTLRAGEAMVAFYAGEKRTYGWVVPQNGAAVMVAAPLDRAAVAASVARLRAALEPNAATLDDIPRFDVAEAYKLYQALLQPAEAAWSAATDLFVVADGALAQLPLSLLVTSPVSPPQATESVPFARYRSVPWLVRKVAVTQLPSVASLAALRAVPPANAASRAFVGIGDPWFSKEQAADAAREAAATQVAGLTTRGVRLRSAPKGEANFSAAIAELPRLPETADEVRAVAAALHADPDRDVILGAKASRSAVKSMNLSTARIVMFATHGLVPGDLAGLNQPALALAAPEVTGNPADGLLTVEDILALRLNADWVVLSACNTAAGQGAGAEAVSGLGRAFFYAGTRALLVSNWPVETTSARTLTTDLFARQVADPKLGRAEALRQAELALIDGPGAAGADGKPLFSYAHPIFWAPFSLVGDGGVNAAIR